MRIVSVEIAGFRSYKSPVTINLEESVTVIMGANDHGKTNLLLAIAALNDDVDFTEEDDLSWDLHGQADNFPQLGFTIELDDWERSRIAEKHNHDHKSVRFVDGEDRPLTVEKRQVGDPPQLKPVYVDPTTDTIIPSSVVRKIEEYPEGIVELKPKDVPHRVLIKLTGCDKTRTIEGLGSFPEKYFWPVLTQWMPRVELIPPWNTISDAVTWAELKAGSNEFMRGILYYGGIEPDASEELFHQTDFAAMRLSEASKTLNDTLKRTWTQGEGLEFSLQHNSKNSSIELRIRDPAVTSRYVRASKRSSGFTHYFTLKTILHAREKDHDARSRLLAFDEPGIYLHPAGQMDLLRVLRELGKENQVVYVTHSLFMIDKNVPTAHRLLHKGEHGTQVDGKPYSSRWARAMSSLGITLSGSILFANHVLLTEGDSDPIYLYAAFSYLNQLGMIDIDLNALAIISTNDGKNADALIRMLAESSICPKMLYLTDGDSGGKERAKEIAQLCSNVGATVDELSKGTAIEDHMIDARRLLVQAAAEYAVKLRKQKNGEQVQVEGFVKKLEDSIKSKDESSRNQLSLGKTLPENVALLIGLKNAASKVGIAREYAILLESGAGHITKRECDRAIRLAEKIKSLLGLPGRNSVQKSMTDPS